MAHRSRAAISKKARVPAVVTDTGAIYAYEKHQLEQASSELATMAKEEFSRGRFVNKAAGDLRVRSIMHRKHYYNALAAGEDPRKDEGYRRDMIKRECIVEVPVHSDSITARPLSEQGRQEFDRIFGKN